MPLISSAGRAFLVLSILAAPRLVGAQPLVYETSRDPSGSNMARLHVINTASQNVVASLDLGIAAGRTQPAVAISQDGRTAYVTAGQDLLVVDTTAMTLKLRVPLGSGLGALAISADGARVYVANVGASSVVVLATASLQPDGAAIPLPHAPTRLALTPAGTLYVLAQPEREVYVVDTAARAVTGTIATGESPREIAAHPDGSRVYVVHSTGNAASPSADSLTVYDTTSRTEIATLVLPDFRANVGFFMIPSSVGPMAMLPSGAMLYLPRLSAGWKTSPTGFVRRETVHAIDTSTLTIASSVTPIQTAATVSLGFGAAALADGNQVIIAGGGGASAIDTTTNVVTAAGPGVQDVTSVAVASAPDCWFEAAPQQTYVRATGGTVVIDVPAPAGCSWTATASDTWLVPSMNAGTGLGTLTLETGATAVPRSGHLSISGQTVSVDQLVQHTVIDTPASGLELTLPFDVRGWAIERDARDAASFATGIDRVDLWDQTGTGSGPVFIGTIGVHDERPDIAAAYGERYRYSGFARRVGRLPAGTRTLVAYAHSRHDGAFNAVPVTVTIRRAPTLIIDTPAAGGQPMQPFRISGWAADMTAPTGTGVDVVHIYAYPATGGAPIFVGAATYGIDRADVGFYFGDQPFRGGFGMDVTGLQPGRYTLVAFARCTTTGTFDAATSVAVTVDNPPPPGAPFGALDTPLADSTVVGAISVAGWALDDATVAKVTVFREPVAGEAGLVPIGDAAFVEGVRPDVASAFPNYPANTRAGWGLMVLTNMLPNGGSGPFTFHAEAYDAQGNATELGRRTVVGNNAASDLPFGTIDAPGQGAAVSGVVPVFGWALTPGPAIIPPDGSTIEVLVDDVSVGHPAFNQCRGTNGSSPAPGTCDDDIATIFGSRYRNIAEGRGAIGSFLLDTTMLTNGIHTLGWRVTDSAGKIQGIGSRYIYVNNP